PVVLGAGAGVREAAREVELEQWAWRKVRKLRFLYTHLTIFALGNFILLLVDVSTPGETWFYKVLLRWGLIAGLHAASAAELPPGPTRDGDQPKAPELIEERRQRSRRT